MATKLSKTQVSGVKNLIADPSTGAIGQQLMSDPSDVSSRKINGVSPQTAVSTTNRGVDQMSGEQPTNMYGQGPGGNQ